MATASPHTGRVNRGRHRQSTRKRPHSKHQSRRPGESRDLLFNRSCV